MSKIYTDYAEEWKIQHPFWVFMMGIGRDRVNSWNRFGPGSPYEKYPQEGGLLSLYPFKTPSYIFTIIVYIVLCLFLIGYTYFYTYTFKSLMLMSVILTGCHIVYIYYLTNLPIMSHKIYKHEFCYVEIMCIIGLFIPLMCLHTNYENYKNFNSWVVKHELQNKYSDVALRSVYWSINHHGEDKSSKETQIDILREKFNLPKINRNSNKR